MIERINPEIRRAKPTLFEQRTEYENRIIAPDHRLGKLNERLFARFYLGDFRGGLVGDRLGYFGLRIIFEGFFNRRFKIEFGRKDAL